MSLYIRAGLTDSYIGTSDVEHLGWHTGVGARLSLSKRKEFNLCPELRYTTKGGTFRYQRTDDKISFGMSYIEVPVIAMYIWNKNHWQAGVGAGPHFAYGLGGKVKAPSDIFFYEGFYVAESPPVFSSPINMARFDFGWTIQLTAGYKNMIAIIDIERGRKINNHQLYFDKPIRNTTLLFSLGYRFNIKKDFCKSNLFIHHNDLNRFVPNQLIHTYD